MQEKPYRFDGEVIKLTQKHYDAWEKAFPFCDLETELMLLDCFWQNERDEGEDIKKWFYVTACKLRYRNDQLKRAGAQPKGCFDRLTDTSWADDIIQDNVVRIGNEKR